MGFGEHEVVARLLPEGSLDAGFGVAGMVSVPISPNSKGTGSASAGMVVQDDDKILLAGYTTPSRDAFLLIRLNSDGTFDTSFGAGGTVLDATGTAIGLQPEARSCWLDSIRRIPRRGSAGLSQAGARTERSEPTAWSSAAKSTLRSATSEPACRKVQMLDLGPRRSCDADTLGEQRQ